jgi:lysophospholipase L1-like esterase
MKWEMAMKWATLLNAPEHFEHSCATRREASMKHMRICFVGDSFVNGTGDPTFLGWVGRLCVAAQQQGYEITSYNLGIRGQTSRQVAQRWQAEVTARLPRDGNGRLVFSFGANDMTLEDGELRVPLAESLQNARSLLTTAQQLFPTIMIGPPPLLDDEHCLISQDHELSLILFYYLFLQA